MSDRCRAQAGLIRRLARDVAASARSLALLLCASVSSAAPGPMVDGASAIRPIPFEHLATTDGLPQGTVHTTLEDSQGYVWIGTEDGLVRYDGRELHRYSYSARDRTGLPGNFVQKIVEDANHDLWLAIRGSGLAHWRRATDSFSVLRHDPRRRDSLTSDIVNSISLDSRGRLWVGTSDGGIDVVDPVTEHIAHFTHDSSNRDSLASNHVNTLVRDSSDTLWIGTDAGLDRLNSDERTFTHYGHFDAGKGSDVTQVLRDRSGSIWVGTQGGGLVKIDPNGHVEHIYRHDARDPGSLASDSVHALLEDGGGQIWVGTTEGLDLFDRRLGRFAHYRHNPMDPSSLRDSDILSLSEGSGGLLWVGTRAGGVSRWNRHAWELGAQRPEWLAGSGVTAFADGQGRQLWVSSLGHGLARLNEDTGTWTTIDQVVGRADALGDRNIMSLHLDRHGALWIGTMNAGLKVLAPNGSLRSIPVRPGDPRSTSAAGIMTIHEAGDGRLWVGTYGGGVNIVDPDSGAIQQLPYGKDEPGTFSSGMVTAIVQDQTGNFWVGTLAGGLNLVDRNGRVQRVFRHDPEDPSSLASNTIYALKVDAEGRLWAAPESGGLQRIAGNSGSPDSIRFMSMSSADGLTGSQIYGILADSAGRLWLSGNAGLTRYDPRDDTTKSFHVEQGAQGEEFNYNAFHQLRDGRLCFGGPGGFNVFDPTKLTEHSEPPRVALTSIAVMGKEIERKLPYWRIDEVNLAADASIVSLDFATLNYTSTRRNQLSYRMAGLTDNWIDLGTQTRISLTNLEPGDHVLEVRGATRNSDWSRVPLRLRIHRAPPAWRSPTAFAAYAALSLLLISWFVAAQRQRSRDQAAAHARLEAEVASRTRALRETNRQLEEAAQARSSILARMSHELRTPMNGVVGMTELLLRTPQSATQERLTRTIRSSADLLLHILNDLLDLSKAQADKIRLEQIPIDLGLVLEESAALFAGSARDKSIELTVCPPINPTTTLLGDPLRIRQILLNLIGNAVKFTDFGEVTVAADVTPDPDGRASLTITVTDSGIGMDASAIERIFEPFAQADESTTRRFGGTGLGLAICRELARLMDGTISVQSRPGRGSTFTASLKLKTATLDFTDATKPLLRGSVAILSHSPSLVEAMSRHVRNFGLRQIAPSGRLGDPVTAAGALIVDAATHAPDLRELVAASDRRLTSLVVIASPAEDEALGLSARLAPAQIVGRPVQRDALYRGLRYATSEGHDRPVAAAGVVPRVAPMRGHVLVVEDEAVNAAVAQGYLESMGCTAVWVDSGAAAIERFRVDAFDLVLMDLNMPEMDGFETTRRLRALPAGERRVPIIALTAHDQARFGAACAEAGIDDMLTKPYTFDACAAMLRRWLGPATDTSVETPVAHGDTTAGDGRNLAEVDPVVVERLRGVVAKGAVSLYARLTELFRAGSPMEIERLGKALDATDLAAASAICHRLKASAGNLGATQYARAVSDLEALCDNGDLAGARTAYERIAQAHPLVLEALAAEPLRARA
jgi:signal transduction histidine kinase/ligand-binding sensor domain-containing protein/CheY-like chemotaxis protein/HPt (histidine-containing phosphotransfer) domain-containing protein